MHTKAKILFSLFVLALFASLGNVLHADLVVANFNALGFDNDRVGDSSDPILDPDTGTVVTFTTRFITGDGTLWASSDELGIDRGAVGGAGGDRAGFFDDGDAWSFDADQHLSLTRVMFADFSRAQLTANEDVVLMQSDDWIGLANVSPDLDQVAFNAASGTFTFTAIPWSEGNDFDFDLGQISGGVALPVFAGTDITFTDASNNTFGWQLDAMEFTTNAVPEPTSIPIFILATSFTVSRRRRRVKS